MNAARKRGRPSGRKMTSARTVLLDPQTAAVLRTSARYAVMPESAWIRSLIQRNAIMCPICEYDACVCGQEPLRGVDAVLI